VRSVAAASLAGISRKPDVLILPPLGKVGEQSLEQPARSLAGETTVSKMLSYRAWLASVKCHV
jgi:hypothetical protein